MKRIHRVVGFFLLFVSTTGIFAGPPPPLVMEVQGQKPVIVEDYQMTAGQDPRVLNIRVSPSAAEELKALTEKHVGRTLNVKQGNRVIFSPKIKEALKSQDFIISFKTAKEREDFLTPH